MNDITIHIDTELLEEVLTGLRSTKKRLPSKLFYDERGSKLFDQICDLEEYYPTRTELMIMKENIDDIASFFRENSLFIEFGSGSSLKTRLLLDHINNLAGYVPIDISEEHLNQSVESLRSSYPDLEIHSVAADYTKPIEFPDIHHIIEHKIAFFPGSTIGNFTLKEAKEFLEMVASECGDEGGLLIGVDLKKDKNVLEAAYNDSMGVTADFNLNMLERLNKEYNFNFDLEKFNHFAFYNEEFGRIEMNLISQEDQIVTIDNEELHFKKDESILTEYSHRYSIEEFSSLAANSFAVEKVWTDERNYFSVQFLSVKS